jgi:hypothetical protein
VTLGRANGFDGTTFPPIGGMLELALVVALALF